MYHRQQPSRSQPHSATLLKSKRQSKRPSSDVGVAKVCHLSTSYTPSTADYASNYACVPNLTLLTLSLPLPLPPSSVYALISSPSLSISYSKPVQPSHLNTLSELLNARTLAKVKVNGLPRESMGNKEEVSKVGKGGGCLSLCEGRWVEVLMASGGRVNRFRFPSEGRQYFQLIWLCVGRPHQT